MHGTVDHRSLEYFVGSETKPKNGDGPLALFNTRENAIKFVHNFCVSEEKYRVYRCHYLESNRKKLYYMKENGKPIYSNFALPEGSVLAESVVLIEEVSLTLTQ